jgi:hypothetical protein
MSWIKKAQKGDADLHKLQDLALSLCGILYTINKKYTEEWIETIGDKNNIMHKYTGLMRNAVLKFNSDNNLGWDTDFCDNIITEIDYLGNHDFNLMLSKILYQINWYYNVV